MTAGALPGIVHIMIMRHVINGKQGALAVLNIRIIPKAFLIIQNLCTALKRNGLQAWTI